MIALESEPSAAPVVPATTRIRVGRSGDLERVVDLHAATFHDGIGPLLGRKWTRARYAGLLARSGHVTVACQGDLVVGFVSVRVPGVALERPFRAAIGHGIRGGTVFAVAWRGLRALYHEVRGRGAAKPPLGAWAIDYIAVDARHRGQGIASALVRAAMDLAPDQIWVVTTTVDNRAAIRAYQKAGFHEHASWIGFDARRYVRLRRDPGISRDGARE